MASVQSASYNGRYLKLTVYEESTSIANNTSTIRWIFESTGGSDRYYSIYHWSIWVNGQLVYGNGDQTTSWSSYAFPAATGSVTGTITVGHKADGSGPNVGFRLMGCVYNASYNNYDGSCGTSKIPRYASITKFTVDKIDETSVKVTWGASNACDKWWYSTNNGGNWVETTGYPNFNIEGLTAGTGYNFKLRCRRKDSQLTTDSGTVYQSTYPYPSINSTPNITIGDELNIGINNPLNRSCTVHIIANNESSTELGKTTETSVSGLTSEESIKWLYNSIPDSDSGKYKVRLVVDSPSRDTTTDGGAYNIIGNNEEAPVFEDFKWKDNDPLASNLTGQNGVQDPKILIAGMSNVEFTVPVANKMVSNFGATPKSYGFNWGGGASTSSDYSDTEDVSNQVNDGNADTISVTAYDKRNQYTTVTKSGITIIKPIYADSQVETHRRNGVETITYLNGYFRYWSGDWANGSKRPNKLLKILMSVNGGTPIDITQSVINNSESSTDTNTGLTTLTIKKNTLQVHSNGQSGGFSIGTGFNLSFYIYTGLNTTYYYDNNRLISSCIVNDGKIGMSRYKDSNGDYHYGFNGMPNDDYNHVVHGSSNTDDLYVNDGLYIGSIKTIWYEDS